MTDINKVSASEMIAKLSEQLTKESKIKAPAWSAFAKTGSHKERPPEQKDWWHIRTAAVFRTVAIKGPIGVSKLRVKYGGKPNRGHKTEHFRKGSGSVARNILKQLEESGLVRQTQKGAHKGRIITKKGAEMINAISKGKNGTIQTSKQEKKTK